jgi:hypothetical protein
MAVALDDEFVYWSSFGNCPIDETDIGDGQVFGVRRADGSAAFMLDRIACPNNIVVSGDDLFWTDHFIGASWISTAKRDGTQARPLFKQARALQGLRVDAQNIYYFDTDGIYQVDRPAMTKPRTFVRVELVNGDTQSPFVIDDKNVYWIDEGSTQPGGVYRAAKADGVPVRLAAVDQPEELAISSAGLFWADDNLVEPHLSFLAWGETTPQLLAVRSLVPNSLAAVGNDLYWVEGGADHPGGVYHLTVGKRDVSEIVKESTPFSISADSQFVFWTDANEPNDYNGSVMRMCR